MHMPTRGRSGASTHSRGGGADFDMAAGHFTDVCSASGFASAGHGLICMQKALIGPWPKHYLPAARASQLNVPVLVGLAEFLELTDPYHHVELFEAWLSHAAEASIQQVRAAPRTLVPPPPVPVSPVPRLWAARPPTFQAHA